MLMMVLSLGGVAVVMRAAFTMLMLVLALSGVAVIMRAAFTMLMMVLVSGRMICCIHSSICKSGNKAQ